MSHTSTFIDLIWRKGRAVSGHPSTIWRKDQCGAWIKRSAHGDRDSQFGWEIDRISAGGSYTFSNCRPLQWQNNVSKGNGRLKCRIIAKSNKIPRSNKST